MSVNTNYELYTQSGGLLSEIEYNSHLNNLKDSLGGLINNDPKNCSSDIGKKIFEHLNQDLPSAIAFTKVSKGLNARSKHLWFSAKSCEIVLKYVQNGTTYSDYLLDEGWKDFFIIGTKVTCLVLMITGGVKASRHASNIPSDAPTKTITSRDECGKEYEMKYIDHPEARASEMWAGVAYAAALGTVASVAHSIYGLLKDVNLDLFFSASEKEIVGLQDSNLGLRMISPSFQTWKMTKMKEKLTSNPPNWTQHAQLKTMVCPISEDFMLFPVKDKCNHYFDYRSIRAYQLDPKTVDPMKCPLSKNPNNAGLSRLQFDKARFDQIQELIY